MNFQEWCSVNSGLSISLLKDKKVDLVNEIMKYKWMEELSQFGFLVKGIDKAIVDCNERSEEYLMKQIKELKEKNMKLETLAGTEHMKKNILQEENEKLKEELLHEQQKGTSIDTEAMDELVNIFDEKIASCDIPEEVKKLKELTDGIMNEPNTQHILGCNSYEKFSQAMTELKYDEQLITELKESIEKYKQYEEHEETIMSSLNFYTEQCEELKEERKELKKSIKKKDKQIALLVNYKKKREQQIIRMKKICEEKIEDPIAG